MSDFAAVLRNRRIALGMTQKALSEEMGTTQSHVCELERGNTNPTLPVAQRWAAALHFDVRLIDRLRS